MHFRRTSNRRQLNLLPDNVVKNLLLLLVTLASFTIAQGQATSSIVEVVTVFSPNGRFFLKSVPYDNEFPSLWGKTYVYQTGKAAPLYEFDRGFDSVEADRNNLILSNDGETIFFAIPWEANESIDGLKSVTIYRHGKIIKSFTETEVNGCDRKTERCRLLYDNYETAVDREQSNFGSKAYRKTFRAGVDEKERFLSDFPIFSVDDAVYLIDSKKVVHVFDLKEGQLIRSVPFDDLFEQIRTKARLNRVELKQYEAPVFLEFPRLRNGKDTQATLAKVIGMKPASSSEPRDEQFKQYSFKISATISRDGSLNVEKTEFWDERLPREQIIEFFKTNRFDTSAIPPAFDKWHIGDEYFYFRHRDDRVARSEKKQETIDQSREYQRRLTLETIDGVYIPKDPGDCFLELDKILSPIDKKEILALAGRTEMVQYHMGLGMWMRNNWRLWAGSRLQKYFLDRGIRHPDDMSGVILEYYYDWLKGQKESWKDWDKNPRPR